MPDRTPLPDDAWRKNLKEEVPRDRIPVFLTDLQRLVAGLRSWRDDLQVPTPADVAPLLSPLLRAHPDVTLGYLDDERYTKVVRDALTAPDPAQATDHLSNRKTNKKGDGA